MTVMIVIIFKQFLESEFIRKVFLVFMGRIFVTWRQKKNNPMRLIQTATGVSHCSIAIYIKKYLKSKEELWKLKSFTMQKYINLQKHPLKQTKILLDIMTL